MGICCMSRPTLAIGIWLKAEPLPTLAMGIWLKAPRPTLAMGIWLKAARPMRAIGICIALLLPIRATGIISGPRPTLRTVTRSAVRAVEGRQTLIVCVKQKRMKENLQQVVSFFSAVEDFLKTPPFLQYGSTPHKLCSPSAPTWPWGSCPPWAPPSWSAAATPGSARPTRAPVPGSAGMQRRAHASRISSCRPRA